MEYETKKGLMATNAQPTKRTPVLAEFLNSLAPQQPLTLEQRLAALTDSDRTFMMQLSRMVQAVMQMRIAAGDQSQGYYDLVTQMYGKVSPSKRRLVAEILDASDPLDFEPTHIKKPREDVTSSFYDSPEMQVAPKEPQQMNADFLERLTQSESSGDSNAEITIKDGRRYVGALQFGDARLLDYKKATGSSFTQDEFKADSALQDKVAAWHIADIDKTIDGLGINTDGYDRDGLRAVAHLGGKHGMKKFVRSNGEYNPSDELGTSLQDYYDKFAVQS
ncbi:hypothetical protein [Planktomarina temperata]|uniref:Uncharacterized protein n=1 Tax=Planktomarina temperata RCA23 TaxID=666509 RepID=A0AAN0RG96_9RHOB|nr:hypothetical protein RCA23_c00860 [Planktomarina temperata RCA23]